MHDSSVCFILRSTNLDSVSRERLREHMIYLVTGVGKAHRLSDKAKLPTVEEHMALRPEDVGVSLSIMLLE